MIRAKVPPTGEQTASWQEAVTLGSPPSVVFEHCCRYRLIKPLLAKAKTWIDLGCGYGVAQELALSGGLPPTVVLVDNAPAALAEAAKHLRAANVFPLEGDLNNPQFIAELGECLAKVEEPAVVTCFEVIEHLSDFSYLVNLLRKLGEQTHFTCILSVPNDAFSGIENPYHQTIWGEGAVDELRSLLPKDHHLFHQTSLYGSAIYKATAGLPAPSLTPHPPLSDPVPTHFLVAWGGGTEELSGAATLGWSERTADRAWEHLREANLIHAEKLAREREDHLAQSRRRLDRQGRELHKLSARLEETSRVIKELEEKLQATKPYGAQRAAG